MPITSSKERSTTFLVGSQITNGYPRPTFRRIPLARSSDSQTRKTHSRAENQQSDEHKSYNAITIVHVPHLVDIRRVQSRRDKHHTRLLDHFKLSRRKKRDPKIVSTPTE